MGQSWGEQEPIDLHGRRPADAERFLAQRLHACRVRGDARALVITGRGWGNRTREPILRQRIETWLRGPEAARLGVRGFQRVNKGGALQVELG